MDDRPMSDKRCGAQLSARWECRPDAHGVMRPVLVWGTAPAVLPELVKGGARLVEVASGRPSVVAAAA